MHDGIYVIGMVDASMLSQTSRMKGTLSRHLSGVIGQSNVLIRFEIAQISRNRGIFQAGNFVGRLDWILGCS